MMVKSECLVLLFIIRVDDFYLKSKCRGQYSEIRLGQLGFIETWLTITCCHGQYLWGIFHINWRAGS